MENKIKFKSVKYCPECERHMVSWNRHDFKECPHGVMIDGGNDYLRCSLKGNTLSWNLETGEMVEIKLRRSNESSYRISRYYNGIITFISGVIRKIRS